MKKDYSRLGLPDLLSTKEEVVIKDDSEKDNKKAKTKKWSEPEEVEQAPAE